MAKKLHNLDGRDELVELLSDYVSEINRDINALNSIDKEDDEGYTEEMLDNYKNYLKDEFNSLLGSMSYITFEDEDDDDEDE